MEPNIILVRIRFLLRPRPDEYGLSLHSYKSSTVSNTTSGAYVCDGAKVRV